MGSVGATCCVRDTGLVSQNGWSAAVLETIAPHRIHVRLRLVIPDDGQARGIAVATQPHNPGPMRGLRNLDKGTDVWLALEPAESTHVHGVCVCCLRAGLVVFLGSLLSVL